MDTQTLELVYALQHSLCELLIYSNRTSGYAETAQAIAQEAGRVLREHGREPVDVPGLPEGRAYATHTHSVTR